MGGSLGTKIVYGAKSVRLLSLGIEKEGFAFDSMPIKSTVAQATGENPPHSTLVAVVSTSSAPARHEIVRGTSTFAVQSSASMGGFARRPMSLRSHSREFLPRQTMDRVFLSC